MLLMGFTNSFWFMGMNELEKWYRRNNGRL
jgi:hypothetical protein